MYEVDQLVYLLSNKNHKIVPAKIESVTTVKKKNGVEVSHELSLPTPEGVAAQVVTLEKLNVKPFSDLASLRQYLLKLIQEKIDADIKSVGDLVSMTWPDSDESPTGPVADLTSDPGVEKKSSPDQAVRQVQLEDGTTARLHLPPEFL